MKKEKNEELELDQALSTSEQFLMKYQKPLGIGLIVIVAIVCIILGVKNYVIAPHRAEAQAELATCQHYFDMDSLSLALNGDNNECIGFLGVIDEYGHTPAGKLAKAYAGICYAEMGQNEDAKEMLEHFSTDEMNANAALKIRLADVYVNLDENDEAEKQYKKVVEAKHDVYSPVALHKLGILYESEGDKDKALEAYQSIKDEYPNSVEAQDVDKYISRLQ